MPSFSATLCLFSLIVLVAALSSPHAARNIHHHRSLAARVAAPDVGTASIRRRQLNKRCKTRSSTSTPSANAASTPTVTPTTTTTTSTSSQAYSPAPSSSPVAAAAAPPPSSSSSPAPSPSPSSSTSNASSNSGLSYLNGLQTGQGTWYSTGLGSCGITNNDTQDIVAVSQLLYDTYPGYTGVNPNTNPVCNKQIKATYQGRSVTVTVTDRCTGCAITDLDFSPNAFNILAGNAGAGLGRMYGMTWVWV